MAQFGSVLEWGSRGRRFESSHPDQKTPAFDAKAGVFYLIFGDTRDIDHIPQASPWRHGFFFLFIRLNSLPPNGLTTLKNHGIVNLFGR